MPRHFASVSLSLVLALITLPPLNAWPAAVIALVPVMSLAMRQHAVAATITGLLFGAALGATTYAGAAVLDATTWLMATTVTALGMAAFLGGVAQLSRQVRSYTPALAGALWACIEMGFAAVKLPFSLGLMLTGQPILLQGATLGGQWLVVALLVASQFALAAALLRTVETSRWAVCAAWFAIGAITTVVGAQLQPGVSGSVRVAAMQTRLHPFDYVHAEADGHLALLRRERDELLHRLDQERVDLIVWPEVAFARFEARAPAPAWPRPGIAQLVAGNDLAPDGRQFNAVFGVDGNAQIVSRHVKSTLLPRLESKYAADQPIAPHSTLPGSPGSLICFESSFPRVARLLAARGAGLITVATSDAFAGPSSLPWLHTGFAVMRAIETRRAVVRAANAGPSSVIGPDGRSLATLGLFDRGVLILDVPVILESTVFVRQADFVRTTFLLLLLPTVYVVFRQDRTQSRPGDTANGDPAPRLRPLGVAGAGTVALTYAVATALMVAGEFHRHIEAGADWPGFGFTAHREFEARYRELASPTERGDSDAAVAALLRRFGLPESAGSVARRRTDLAAQSAFDISVAALLEDYGFASQPMDTSVAVSDLPCIAELKDRTSVVVTRRTEDAAEVFSPAQRRSLTLRRQWLETSFASSPVCVPGRSFAWDLAHVG